MVIFLALLTAALAAVAGYNLGLLRERAAQARQGPRTMMATKPPMTNNILVFRDVTMPKRRA